jgi:hypothetical protein
MEKPVDAVLKAVVRKNVQIRHPITVCKIFIRVC